MTLLDRFRNITACIFDVDGVLTDGRVHLLPGGEQTRTMHVRDGYALQLAIRRGFLVGVVSGAQSDPAAERLRRLGVKYLAMGVTDKLAFLREFCSTQGLDREAVLYMGDDIPDLEAMKAAGLACCPADAAVEIQAISDYIALARGGEGCVREVLERILRLQGDWGEDPDIPSR